MSYESLEEFYSQILGLTEEWEVQAVIRNPGEKEVRITVDHANPDAGICPLCGILMPIHDRKTRKWRHLDSCNHKTFIEADIPRVKCSEHGVHQVTIPWAERGSRFTLELEKQICLWLKDASLSAVAFMFGLSWDVIAGIQNRAVDRGLASRRIIKTKHIGIDETSFKKRHEYVSVILDKETNTVIDVLQDRKAGTLDQWLKTQEMADFTAIQSISMDMWDAFIKAVKANFSDADALIAFDRYHVAQHIGKAVDKVRSMEHQQLLMQYGKSKLTGTKYDWLRTSTSIDNRSKQRKAFLKLARMNLKTARAWRIKEAANALWDFTYMGVADKRWKELLGWMCRSKLKPILKVAKTIKAYFWGIRNAIHLKANNAMLESINSGIQRIKKMACGFRNRDRFRKAILFHFGDLNFGF
jgi:transposase